MATRKHTPLNGQSEEIVEDRPTFGGFQVPEQNWFRLPNSWTDITASMRSWAEHKVVEYVLRHTWGYQEYGILKRISLDEFEHGRKRADGSRLDAGIGMNKQAIISGIRQAVEDGFLIEETDDSDRGRVKKYYGLKMADHTGEYDNHTPGVRRSHPPRVKITHRTTERHPEKETLSETLEETTTAGEDVVVDLISMGVTRDAAEDIASRFDEDYLYTKIEYLEWKLRQQKGKSVDDPAAWLVTAIERDYQPPDGFKPSWVQQAEETAIRERAKAIMDASLAAFYERYGDT